MSDWRRNLPHPALVFVVVAWGLNFSVIKHALEGLEPSVVALTRYLAMMAVLWVSCIALRIPLKYPKGQFWTFMFAGFLANGIYMICFVEGMQRAGAVQGAIVLATAPVWTALFAIMKKQDVFSPHLAIGGGLAFAGAVIAIVAGEGEVGGSTLGAILVLVSAILWSWSVVLMRPLVVEGSPYAAFTLTFPGGIVALLPYGLFATIQTDWSAVKPEFYWSMTYLVFIAGVGAFAAYYKGLADVGPTKTSMVQFFIPPMAAVFSWLVLGGEFNPWTAVGLLVVVFGTLIASGRVGKGLGSRA